MSLKISYTTLGNWLGKNKQLGEYITWEQWPAIRDYLVANQLLDGSDPRWLTPSEMRSRLIDNSALVLSSTEKQLIEYYRNSTDAGRASIYATAQAQASLAKRGQLKRVINGVIIPY